MTRELTYLDLLICAAFALPGVADLVFAGMHMLSIAVGASPIVTPTGAGAFFVNVAGLFGVFWNIAMLRDEAAELHKIDLFARCAVIALVTYHIGFSDLSWLFAAFIVTELVGGIVKIRWLKTR